MASTGRAGLEAGKDQAEVEEKDQAEAEAARPLIIDWMPSLIPSLASPLPSAPP